MRRRDQQGEVVVPAALRGGDRGLDLVLGVHRRHAYGASAHAGPDPAAVAVDRVAAAHGRACAVRLGRRPRELALSCSPLCGTKMLDWWCSDGGGVGMETNGAAATRQRCILLSVVSASKMLLGACPCMLCE